MQHTRTCNIYVCLYRASYYLWPKFDIYCMDDCKLALERPSPSSMKGLGQSCRSAQPARRIELLRCRPCKLIMQTCQKPYNLRLPRLSNEPSALHYSFLHLRACTTSIYCSMFKINISDLYVSSTIVQLLSPQLTGCIDASDTWCKLILLQSLA